MRRETNYKVAIDEVERRQHDITVNMAHTKYGIQWCVQKTPLMITWSIPVTAVLGTGMLIYQTIEGSQFWSERVKTLMTQYTWIVAVCTLVYFLAIWLMINLGVGTLAARKDEKCMANVMGQKKRTMIYPILMSKKELEFRVIKRVILTLNSVEDFWEVIPRLEQAFNEHFVKEKIRYAGKYRGMNKIELYTKQGIMPQKRGGIIDDELE